MKEKDFIEIINTNNGILQNITRMYCSNKADCEDLYQEIVAQLWKAVPTFRGESKISTWIYRVALNVAISGLRKKKRTPVLTDSENNFANIPDDDDRDYKEEIKTLYKAIEKLSKVERAMILLSLDEQPYEEIADIMGITHNHVRVKIHRIKEKLKTIFEDLNQ